MLKPRISFQFPAINKPSKPTLFFPLLISFLLFLCHGSTTGADTITTNIGAIIDVNSRIGKEQKVAMEIAVQEFNSTSSKHKLSLHFQSPGTDPLQAAYSAEELIKEKQVQVIVGMETWHEAALVADIGNRAQVPVLSLAAAGITPPLAALRWPFLVRISSNASEQVSCISAILGSYKWKRVIAIYEDDIYGGDSGILALLSEALQSFGSVIEHQLVFPPLSSLYNREEIVRKEVTKLLHKKSRVFVVLQSSLYLATHLFKEAKELGLVGRDSVWIVTETVSSLLDSVNNSVISSMQGALGIDQAYFPENNKSFDDFKGKFQKIFRVEYPEEHNYEPGIHASRAYDSISTVAHAVEKLGSTNWTQKMMLESILSSNFTGLSGEIQFNGGELSQPLPVFRIINVIGKRYNELGSWSSEFGFREGNTGGYGSGSMEMWTNSVNWPGKLTKGVPKGWAMPTEATPMKIVIPGDSSFWNFVKVEWSEEPSKEDYTGFCIDVFNAALSVVQRSYMLPYEIYPVNDTYDALVESVSNKTYDAVVGDVTILANRSKYVDFTQPFVESGLSMVVPAKSDIAKAWLFLKPFTKEMWAVTGVVMVCTMGIVWFLEHQSNPEFKRSTAMWFTFSSVFFAHSGEIHSNYTKVVVVVWLFVVFVVTSSYTASLTSMLTVPLLQQPTVTDIDWLRRSNAVVGCDGDSFVKNYLKDVLHFKEGNIREVGNEENYPKLFKSGNITAAFLELPYEKVFLREYCNDYTATGPVYRFGGFGFVFQKGSPIARDFSEAILTISEEGDLKRLEDKWFNQSSCSHYNSSTIEVDRLNLQSFWGLYVISGATSIICLLLSLIRVIKNFCDSEDQGTMTPSRTRIWSRMVRFARFVRNGGVRSPVRAPSIARTRDLGHQSSTKWKAVSPSEISDQHKQGHRPPEIEIPIRI